MNLVIIAALVAIALLWRRVRKLENKLAALQPLPPPASAPCKTPLPDWSK